jgi:hypothetical protein
METTPEHPFYTVAGEWIPAAGLQPSDEIRTADWTSGTVETVQFSLQPQMMYNFTVADAHTYFIGFNRWLVHNTCPIPTLLPGMNSVAEFGEFIQWGKDGVGGLSGGEWALRRMDDLSETDILLFRDAGLTPEIAQRWSDWYIDVSLSNPGNPTAFGRAQLMQYIADRLAALD